MAVLNFENIADPSNEGQVGRIAKDALVTDLGQSEYIHVLSPQREYDILNNLGKDPHVLDRSNIKEVAEQEPLNWVVSANILQLEPNIVMTYDISHVRTGESRSRGRVEGESGEVLWAVVDKLTRAIRSGLELPGAAESEPDRDVAEITTASMDAYQYYLEGMDHFWSFRMDNTKDYMNINLFREGHDLGTHNVYYDDLKKHDKGTAYIEYAISTQWDQAKNNFVRTVISSN